jgi:hypothetical protein
MSQSHRRSLRPLWAAAIALGLAISPLAATTVQAAPAAAVPAKVLAERASAYIHAAGDGRWAVVTPLLAPDVVFTTPGPPDILGPAAFVAALDRLTPIRTRYDVKDIVVQGNEAAIRYDYVTDTSVGAVPCVEWVTFKDGKIARVELIFHTAPWPAVIAELRKRTAPK